MNKYQRIQHVRDLELNTEENILIDKHNRNGPSSLDKFVKDNNLENLSLRTFNKYHEQVKTPAHPFVTVQEAYDLIPELHSKDYSVIVATPINPDDCKFAGVTINRGRDLTIEIVNGPGTVRRVTHQSQVDRRYDVYALDQIDDLEVRYCAEQFKRTGLDAVFEFSWYNIPIGWKKENFICWEVTENETKKSRV